MITPTRPASSQYRANGVWTQDTIASLLRDGAALAPDRVACVEGEVRLSYSELATHAQRFAAALRRLGVTGGEVVTIQLPNWSECVVAFHGVQALGAVTNPVIPIYRETEVGFIVQQARPKVVVIPHVFRGYDYVAMIQRVAQRTEEDFTVVVVRPQGPLPESFLSFDDFLADAASDGAGGSAPEDVSLLLYTSGTTADPKGVLHSHETLIYESRSIAERFSLSDRDTVFMASPVTHITGVLYALIMPLLLRAGMALLDVWDPEQAVDVVERNGCRFTVGATPFLQGMTDVHAARRVPSAITTFVCGGADVPPDLVRRSRQVLDACVVRAYGSTEFPTYCCGRCEDSAEAVAETDGHPIGSVDGRLDDVVDGVGELLVRGPELFLGYLDPSLNDDSFTDDGFFRTGDLASIDAEGQVTIRGRKKDIIIRGGENISAKEVEDNLYGHPGIADVAVVAMPDPHMGEKVCAFVVPTPGEPVASLGDITQFLATRGIAKQKYPERVEVIDALPRTASGKVQKFRLRERVAATLAAGESSAASRSGA